MCSTVVVHDNVFGEFLPRPLLLDAPKEVRPDHFAPLQAKPMAGRDL